MGWLMWLRIEGWKRECRLPYDISLLARLARANNAKRFAKEFAVMLQFFLPIEDGSMLEDPELREMWEEKLAKSKKNQESGRIGGTSPRTGGSKP